jgi:hypothetical protein
VKNAAHRKRRREKAMEASELGSAMTPLNDDDDECTITDLAAGKNGPREIPVESIDQDVVEETEPEETGAGGDRRRPRGWTRGLRAPLPAKSNRTASRLRPLRDSWNSPTACGTVTIPSRYTPVNVASSLVREV